MRLGKSPAILIYLACFCWSAFAQTPGQDTVPPMITGGPQINAVMLDVVPEFTDPKTHGAGIITDLKLGDFRVYDNRKEVPLIYFSNSGGYPIALWFVLQCPQGYPPEYHSEFMRGNTQYLRPPLARMGPDDLVGVAHWCDNARNAIDLPLTSNGDQAIKAIDAVLAEKMNHGENRTGEHAMQDTIAMVLDKTSETAPQHVPVLLFLYGDHCEGYGWETDQVIENLTNASAIVFGMSDGKWKFDPEVSFRGKQVRFLAHYYSDELGGNFYSTPDPKQYSAVLDYILSQLHMRYNLGFKPAADGKKHTVKVELTKEAQSRYHDVQLRYRKRYFAKSQ